MSHYTRCPKCNEIKARLIDGDKLDFLKIIYVQCSNCNEIYDLYPVYDLKLELDKLNSKFDDIILKLDSILEQKQEKKL